MIDSVDTQTIDLFPPAKRGRGRPVTGQAKTGAERTRAYRERLKASQANNCHVTKNQKGQGATVIDQSEFEADAVLFKQIAELEKRLSELEQYQKRAIIAESAVRLLEESLNRTDATLFEANLEIGRLTARLDEKTSRNKKSVTR